MDFRMALRCGDAAMKRRALLIAGPTASGKSAVALALAQRLGGAIVNAEFDAGLSRFAGSHRAAEPRRGAPRAAMNCSAASTAR